VNVPLKCVVLLDLALDELHSNYSTSGILPNFPYGFLQKN